LAAELWPAVDDYGRNMKRVLLGASLLLFGVGLAILLCDLNTFHRYGVHINEVASITEEGYILNWPTGEDPWFAQIPIRNFVLFFWLSAAGTYWLRFYVRKPYRGVIWRGTE
jgi:hypothetical protein